MGTWSNIIKKIPGKSSPASHQKWGTPVMGFNALDDYVLTAPSPQHALDLFKNEWACQLPSPFDQFAAGKVKIFAGDPRVTWAEKSLGGFRGANVLELGPLEAGHTYLLEKMGAESILAVESNRRAYLKCLIVKELLGMSRSRFILGDFIPYLNESKDVFDVIFSSGVLYHMKQPLELLKLCADHAKKVFIWTHYYDWDKIKNNAPIAKTFGNEVSLEHAGFSCKGYHHAYGEALGFSGFCGGSQPCSVWISKDDIRNALVYYGMKNVTIGHEQPDHPGGPAACFAAIK